MPILRKQALPVGFRYPPFEGRISGLEQQDKLHSARAQLCDRLHDLARAPVPLRLRRGQAACTEGQLAESLFLIQKGLIKLSRVSLDGTQTIPEILGSGDCFGEECVAEGQPHYAETATTLTFSVLVKIPRASVLRKLLAEPGFGQTYLNVLVYRVREYEDLLLQQVSETSDQRLARVLTRVARFGQWLDKNTVILPRLTHATLSEMVGTTRPRTTFFVGKLRRLGILRPGSVLCINMHRLFDEILQSRAPGP